MSHGRARVSPKGRLAGGSADEEGGFKDRGAVGRSGDPQPPAEGSGGLTIEALPNGPIRLTGPLTIVASSGREAWHGTQVFLCRCGASKDKPFCDGSHPAAGFEAK